MKNLFLRIPDSCLTTGFLLFSNKLRETIEENAGIPSGSLTEMLGQMKTPCHQAGDFVFNASERNLDTLITLLEYDFSFEPMLAGIRHADFVLDSRLFQNENDFQGS